MKRTLAVFSAGVFASAAVVAGTAAPASAAPCGYYTEGARALYNHCGPTNVTITIDYKWPKADVDLCVGPGIIGLIGGTAWVNGAWYIGGVNCTR